MTIIRRVDTVMTGVAGSPWYNSLHFTNVESTSASTLCAEVDSFWEALLLYSDNDITSTTSAEVVLFDDATQEIVGFQQGTTTTSQGGSSAPRLPAATQALLRLRTDTVAAGRRIQGKIFVPGICIASSTPTMPVDLRGYFDGVLGAFIDESSSFGPLRVNSRKNLTSAVVSSGSTWEQWSVLRSRRD